MQDIATWVCIAQHESNYDTAAVGRLNGDGSADHGLFQISDLYWCSHDSFGGKACNIPCTKLLDSDIGDDVQCVRIIYEEHTRLSGDGFTAWTVYNRNCRNRRVEEVSSCFDSNELSKTQQFLTTTTTTQVSSHNNNYNNKNNSITTTSTGLALPTAKGKVYNECELAQELYYKHHLPLADIPTWVCIAKHESRYNTAAVGRLNTDGSADHGLFQISDLYWCSHDAFGGKACNIPCHKLLDADISDDVQCIQTIHAEHTRLSGDGFTAWVVYNQHCRNQQWERIASCFPRELETHRMQPAVVGNVGTSAHTDVVTSVGKGKIYKKCELAQELYFKHKMPMQEVPTWVCIAEHESSFNTAAVGRLNTDGSADHGLFQISDLYWCSHEVAGGKACHISCNKLLDNDITDDVRCVKTIYDEHTRLSGDGFTAWTVYNRNCRNQQLDRVSSCFDAKELQQAQQVSGGTQPPTREQQHTRPTPSSTEKTKLHVYPTKPYVNSEIFRTTPVKALKPSAGITTPKPATTTQRPQTQTTKQYYTALLTTTTTTTRKPTTLATVVRKPTVNSAVGTTKRPSTASTWNWRQPQQQILPTKATTTRKTTITTRNPTSTARKPTSPTQKTTSTTRKPAGTSRKPTSTSRKTTVSTTRAPQTTTKKSLTMKILKTTKNPGLYQEQKTTRNTVTSTTTRRSQTTQIPVNQKIRVTTTTKRPATTQNTGLKKSTTSITTTKRPAITQNAGLKKSTTSTTTTRRPTTKQSATKTTSRTANSQTANNKTNTTTTTRRPTSTVRRTTAATTTRPTRKPTTTTTVRTPITQKTSTVTRKTTATTRRSTTTATSLNNFSTTKVPYTVKKVTTPTTFTQYTRTSTLKPKITTAKITATTKTTTRKPAAYVASNTSFSTTNVSNKKSNTGGSNKSTSTSSVITTTNPYRDDPFSHPFFAKYKEQFEIFATTTTRKPTSTTRYQLQSRFGDESEYYQQFRNHTAGNVKTVYAYAFGQNGTLSGNYGK